MINCENKTVQTLIDMYWDDILNKEVINQTLNLFIKIQ